jgi:hypothetical protein
MIEGFVNPALAAGAALAAVPIIIHLLNRQRHKPLPWAAMRFVLAAYRKTRRRVQLENILLLLFRALAVAALAFAVARPFSSGGGPLTALREARRDLVLVVDGSASTGYRDGLGSVFDRIRERATELVDELDGARGDRVQLVYSGAWPRLAAWTSPEEARVLLSTLTSPTDEPLDLAAALAEVAALVEDGGAAGSLGAGALDVRLLTDLQRGNFEANIEGEAADEARADAGLVRQLDLLREAGVTVLVEDLGPASERPANLTVVAVEPLGEVPPAGGAFDVAVVVANHGPEVRLAERIWLEVNGERLPSQRVDLPAGGAAETIFTVKIDTPGNHALVGGTAGDALALDDRRASIIAVPAPLRVLVVNGAPSDRFEDDEVALLMTVLEPPDEAAGFAAGLASAAPFAPTEISFATLGAETSGIETADVIVLANTPPLTASVRERIAARVEAGAGLLVAAGDRLGDLTLWSESLAAADGTGLLPVEPLRRVATARRESYYRVAAFEDTHPALVFFLEERWRPLLTEVPIYEFIAARPAPGAVVLARLDDSSSSPLLAERAYGAGRVAFWSTSLSKRWNLVPQSPGTFVPLVHELIGYLGRRLSPDRSVAPGTPLRLVADTFLRGPELVRPDGVTRALAGDATERADGRWNLPEVPASDTERAGVYEVRAAGSPPERFAVQLAPREGDLARASAREIEAIHPALRVRTGEEREVSRRNDDGRGGELWRLLAALALTFLVLESLWGAWIGQRRKQVKT